MKVFQPRTPFRSWLRDMSAQDDWTILRILGFFQYFYSLFSLQEYKFINSSHYIHCSSLLTLHKMSFCCVLRQSSSTCIQHHNHSSNNSCDNNININSIPISTSVWWHHQDQATTLPQTFPIRRKTFFSKSKKYITLLFLFLNQITNFHNAKS